MNNVALQIDQLSKRYRIGESVAYKTLRESITGLLRQPFCRMGLTDGAAGDRNARSFIWALKDITLAISRGDIVAIIGRNGAGKSTLLKILARITRPTSGKAEINGRVGAILEVGTGFHPELTGRENIFLNGAILGMRRFEINRKFDEIVEFAEVEKFIDTPVKRYSSGMYVRLAFSVAAHMEPDILLVDEVLAVGDLAFQRKCLGKMESVANEGRTVVFVSHQMHAVRTLCKSTVWLEAGRVAEAGPTFAVVKHYEETGLQSLDDSAPVVIRSSQEVQSRQFFIQRLEMINRDGNRTNIFSYEDHMTLMVEVGGECKFDQYSLEFGIHKDSGEYVCTGVSCLFHGVYFSRSTRTVRIDIGPLIMTNGRYSISLRLRTEMSIPDVWVPAGIFHIIECNPFALRREIKTPVCVIGHRFIAAD